MPRLTQGAGAFRRLGSANVDRARNWIDLVGRSQSAIQRVPRRPTKAELSDSVPGP
jgi:hypothetical protein